MVSVFDAGAGSVLSVPGYVAPSYGAQPSTFSSGPIWEQQVFLDVTADGVSLTDIARSATIDLGHDVVVASATVELYQDPLISKNSNIVITCGAGPHNVMRFSGLFKRTRANLWPHTYTLLCRGQLSRADEYKQAFAAANLNSPTPSFINQRLPVLGIPLTDLLNGADATDQNIILGVLNRVPGLIVDPANIGGLINDPTNIDHKFGGLAWRDLAWQPYTSALRQAQKLDEVCLGWKLFEGLDGVIKRELIAGYPQGDAAYQFTEGIDILSAIGDLSIEELRNASYVEGYALGGDTGIINAYHVGDNPFMTADNPYIEPFTSSLIEDADFAAQVAQWKYNEINRELVDVQFTTFRDDPLEPGMTITVNLPHAAVTQPVWLQHLQIQVQSKPASFRQFGRGIGGGLPAGG